MLRKVYQRHESSPRDAAGATLHARVPAERSATRGSMELLRKYSKQLARVAKVRTTVNLQPRGAEALHAWCIRLCTVRCAEVQFGHATAYRGAVYWSKRCARHEPYRTVFSTLFLR